MSTATEPQRISVDLLAAGDIHELNDFYNRLHGTTRSAAQFEWEFLNAPAGKALYVVARDSSNHRIIGSQCVIPVQLLTADGRRIRSGKSEDTLVDPTYRGLGVFERMYERLFAACEQDGIACIWGFTSAVKPFRKLGFSVPFDHGQGLHVKHILSSFRFLNSLAKGNGVGKRVAIFGLCCWAWAWGFWRSLFQAGIPEGYVLTITDNVEEGGDEELMRNVMRDLGPHGFAIERSKGLMSWRFNHNPYPVRFRQARLHRRDELVADMIFSVGGNGVCHLVQDLYSPSLPDPLRSTALNRAMNEIGKRNGIALVRSWDFTHTALNRAEIGIRRQAGMVHLQRGISFVWRSLDPSSTLKPEDLILSRMACEGVS